MWRKLRDISVIVAVAAALLSGCGKDEPKEAAKKAPKVKRSKRKKVARKNKKADKDKVAEAKADPAADKANDKGDNKGDEKKAADKVADEATDKVKAAAEVAEKGAPPKDVPAEGEPEKAAVPAAKEGDEPPKIAEKQAPDRPAGDVPEAAAVPVEAPKVGDEPAAPPPTGAAQPAAPAAAAAPAGDEPKPPATGVLPKRAVKLAPTPHVLDKPIQRPDPPLDVTGYLTVRDLELALGKKHKFRRDQLVGSKPTTSYNSLYYAAADGKRFGVSVQVWRDKSLVDSRTRFNTMRNTYTDVVATNRVTEQGFRAYFGEVVTLVFADPRKPVVASVSCSVKLCSPKSIIELSRRVAERLR